MENQQQPTTTTMCRGGCGFFGSTATEGLCSKCFKDNLKRKQDSVRLAQPVPVSVPMASSSGMDISVPEPQTCAQAALSTSDVTAALESAEAMAANDPESSSAVLDAAVVVADLPAPTKKANRCHMCKKKVGLTGFTCRCGGLYCGEHRYDQAHDCSFDYKTMEREEIRKNNPVVVSDKIQRI